MSKLFIDEEYEHKRRERERRNRITQFERHRYVLVKEQWDEDWRWMFIYPTMEAYERGGESQRFVFKYVTRIEYETYREMGCFVEVQHSDLMRGRI